MSQVEINDLMHGFKYHIVYQSDTQRVPREAVMTFLSKQADATSWSCRPVLGTQIIPDHWIKKIEKCSQGERPYIDKRVRR